MIYGIYIKSSKKEFEFCTSGITKKSNSKRVAFFVSLGMKDYGLLFLKAQAGLELQILI